MEVRQPLRNVLHVRERFWLILTKEGIHPLLSSELVDLELLLELLLDLELFLSRTFLSLQIDEEIRRTHLLEPSLQLVVFLLQVSQLLLIIFHFTIGQLSVGLLAGGVIALASDATTDTA